MYGSVQWPAGSAMPSQKETAKIKAKIERMEFTSDDLTDTRVREVIEIRIKKCRDRLLRLKTLLRQS